MDCNLNKKSFMERFGHLRPGTYDILALRYDQREELDDYETPIYNNPASSHFELPEDEKRAIDDTLIKDGYEFNTKDLFDFMGRAIAGREYAKLVFTRNVSDALELIAEWGIKIGLNRDELSYLEIGQIFKLLTRTFPVSLEETYRNLSREAAAEYQLCHAIRLPYLISKSSDVFIVPLLKSHPNYITKNRIHAPLHFITGQELEVHCRGHIILIERADPGYDWIFLNQIAGLITMYGGANSHMAIRCAELGIPAAIGCGEQMFAKLRKAKKVILDCAARLIVPTT
jgi:phosphohistidine swiveling domain-containing protein